MGAHEQCHVVGMRLPGEPEAEEGIHSLMKDKRHRWKLQQHSHKKPEVEWYHETGSWLDFGAELGHSEWKLAGAYKQRN